MAKQYKGFKGSGMRGTKMAHYKMDRLVREYFGRYLANGCKIPKETEPQKIEHNSLCETETYKVGE